MSNSSVHWRSDEPGAWVRDDPKGVVYTHRSQFLHGMGTLQVGSMGISETDVILPAVPMFHANCWGLPYTAGLAGAKLIMLDRQVGDGKPLSTTMATRLRSPAWQQARASTC